MLISYFALLAILATGCLTANTRVLNGKPATPHQFPYHVGIYTKWLNKPISRLEYQFGGAVISDKWVLTTGYIQFIVSSISNIFVKAGKHVVDQEEAGEQVRLVVRYIIHPEYKTAYSGSPIAQNDLALLKVNIPFVFNEYVSAAGIPSSSNYFSSGSLAGWGAIGINSYGTVFPKELHYDAWLSVINTQDCADAINAVASSGGSSSVEISSNQTCTGPVNQKWGACLKDDGSALVSQVDDKYVLIGIVCETTIPCGYVERPTVYTRVGAQSEWIHGVMESS